MSRRAVRWNRAQSRKWVDGWDFTLLIACRIDWLSVHITRLAPVYYELFKNIARYMAYNSLVCMGHCCWLSVQKFW